MIEPLLPVVSARSGGRPRGYPPRLAVDTILHVLVAGCAWRMVPHDLVSWSTAYRWFAAWTASVQDRAGAELVLARVRGLLERACSLVEDLGRGPPAEDLAGPVVDRRGDGFKVFDGPPRQTGAFRQVLRPGTERELDIPRELLASVPSH